MSAEGNSPNTPSLRWPHLKLSKQSILHNNRYNKGTGFSLEERAEHHIRGLLPPVIEDLEQQHKRAIAQFREFETPLQKYIYITSLQQRNETLFYYTILKNMEEVLPIIYTPTVGEACLKFSQGWRTAQGMYLSEKTDKGEVRKILDNWEGEVDIIVVTDGSRILGLGDLGVNGMGIPIGKLSLYVAGAGFNPRNTLPITIDVGTNNEKFLADPFYLGSKNKRIDDARYYEFMDEFMAAVFDKWPNCLVQHEDFSNDHCFDLLERYRNKYRMFNDDIQGTGAVIASGFINAVKLTGIPFDQHRLVFYGAGSAGVGVADAIVRVMEANGVQNGRSKFWLVDSKGLVTNNRGDKLQSHKIPYARTDQATQLTTLLDVVRHVKPTALIGLAGVGPDFTPEIIAEMAKFNQKPIIFALSNPTSKSECSAKDAYTYTNGTCVFASGSPFAHVELNGKTYIPSQGNNMYVFPGLGMGAFLAQATTVSDTMIMTASIALARCVTAEELAEGRIYPRLNKIRELSKDVATAVMEKAYEEGVARVPKPKDIRSYVSDHMYVPSYDNHTAKL